VLTRNLDSPKAQRLADLGAELVRGNFDDSASLRAALAGVSAAYSVQQWDKDGVEVEEARGKRFADEVKAVGAPHLVYSSVEGAERRSGVPHFESKWHIEQHIRELGLSATILRPVGFMDFFPLSGFQRAAVLGMFRAAFGLSHRIQLVATNDIGWFAARAMEDSQRFAGRVIPIAGDDLTVGDMLKTYKLVTGNAPFVAPVPGFVPKRLMPKDLRLMFKWIAEHGFEANISDLKKEYPQLTSFAAYLKKRAEGNSVEQAQPKAKAAS